MLIVRLIAIALMGVFAYCAFRLFSLWQTRWVALTLAILLMTLPSLQMYVSAAPLFAPSLAYCAVVVMLFGRFCSRENNSTAGSLILVFSTLGLTFVWATYQAIPLVVIGLLTPMILSDRWAQTPRWRYLLVFLGLVVGSLVLYLRRVARGESWGVVRQSLLS